MRPPAHMRQGCFIINLAGRRSQQDGRAPLPGRKALKDGKVVSPRQRAVQGLLAAQGPGGQEGTEAAAHQPHGRGAVLGVGIGDEMRPAESVDQQVLERKVRGSAGFARPVGTAHRQLAAHHAGRMQPEIPHGQGMKALHAIGAAVGAQMLQSRRRIARRASVVLDLHDQRNASVHQREHLAEKRNARAVRQRMAAQLLTGDVTDAQICAAYALEAGVVVHHEAAVTGELYVQLNAVARLHRAGKGGQAVFGHVAAVQAAVRVQPAREGGGVGPVPAGSDQKEVEPREKRQAQSESTKARSWSVIPRVKSLQPAARRLGPAVAVAGSG